MPDGFVHMYFTLREGEPQLMATIATAILDDFPDLGAAWRKLLIEAIDRKVQSLGGPAMLRYEEVRPPEEH